MTKDEITGLDIRSCPFCGKDASIEEISIGVGECSFSVGCETDDADNPCYGCQSLVTFARRSDAIKAWNTRKTENGSSS